MRRRHAGIRTAALTLVAALAFAGCGGTGGKRATPANEASGASGLSRAEYIAQLDAICEESYRVAVRFGRRFAAIPRTRDDRALLRARRPIFEEWARFDRAHGVRIRAVVPAPSYRAEAERYLAESTANEALNPRLAKAMREGDVRGYRLFDALSSVHWRRARRAAVAFGFRVCGGQRRADEDGPAAGGERGESGDQPRT